MNLIQESFQLLFPDKIFDYTPILKYNKKLGDFNSSIRLTGKILQVNLNYKWREIDPEIRIGLIQSLLLKLFARKEGCKKISTYNIEFYYQFIKKIPSFAQKKASCPLLEDSFHQLNQTYFNSLLEKPNLVWGAASFRKLASYNFHNDTITISTIFKEAPKEILDYLIYHELLHKKQQFDYKNNRTYYHTRTFRKAENLFPDKKQIEGQINQLIKQYRKRGSFFSCLAKSIKI